MPINRKTILYVLLAVLFIAGCVSTFEDSVSNTESKTANFIEGEIGNWGWYKDAKVNSIYAITENNDGSQLWVECFLNPDFNGCAVMMALNTVCQEDEVTQLQIQSELLAGNNTAECWGGDGLYRYFFEDYDMVIDYLNVDEGVLNIAGIGNKKDLPKEQFSLSGALTAIESVFEYYDAQVEVTN